MGLAPIRRGRTYILGVHSAMCKARIDRCNQDVPGHWYIRYLAPPAKIAILAEFSQSENVHSG